MSTQMQMLGVDELFPGWEGQKGLEIAVFRRLAEAGSLFFSWADSANEGQLPRTRGAPFMAQLGLEVMSRQPSNHGYEVHHDARNFGGARLLGGKGARLDPSMRMLGAIAVGEDVTVRASSRITGPTVLGNKVCIGGSAVVSRCVIGEGSSLQSGVVAGDAIIGRGVHIGAGVVLQSEPDDGSSEVVITDFRHIDQPEIRTGQRVAGVCIGDGCKVYDSLRAGTVLPPDCVVPMGSDLPSGAYTKELLEAYTRERVARTRTMLQRARDAVEKGKTR